MYVRRSLNSMGWRDRYLGLFIVRSRAFKCSLYHAKRSFYRAVNEIFGRIERTAPEEVILELIKSKCLPILLYGLEAYPLNKTNLRSLDFSVNRFFKKLFNTSDIQTVTECQLIFGFKLPSAVIADRSQIFLTKYDSFVQVFSVVLINFMIYDACTIRCTVDNNWRYLMYRV